MNIGILGTGVVGQAIGAKLVHLGHEVKMGSRTADSPKAHAWAQSNGPQASHGTFADAAAFGKILFNCTAGVHSLEALELAGAVHLRRENSRGRRQSPGLLAGDAALGGLL